MIDSRDCRIPCASPRLIVGHLMKPKVARKRIDLLLVERGCADSPQRAMAMILAGEVLVDGRRAEKAGIAIAQDARIEIISRVQKFVSRGGLKLEGALEDFAIDPTGSVCLDIGSSNGGFTDCLLQHGAERVDGMATVTWRKRGKRGAIGDEEVAVTTRRKRRQWRAVGDSVVLG